MQADTAALLVNHRYYNYVLL